MLLTSDDSLDASAPLLKQKGRGRSHMNKQALYTIALIQAFSVVAGASLPDPPAQSPCDGFNYHLLGSCFAWVSLVSYILSRLPQIVKNHRDIASGRGCVGLSIWLFVFALLGNLTYSTSILLRAYSPDNIAADYGRNYLLGDALPYLLGSLGTIVFDSIIFAQWWTSWPGDAVKE